MAYGLTPRQKELLRYIDQYIRDTGGVGPSLQEMAESLGYKFRSSIHPMLKSLEAKGHIRRLTWQARAIEIVGVAK